ncbi:MAG TPA: asparagine synthase-related protein [Thermoanaerobaculia bacterium]|jgi:asparagine synthase (glutamine-hydrolysing)|nr:asparagine synthase-related protein [Thermoanaerobaculia bacterium]
MPFPFTPGLTEPRLVDLSDPSSDVLLDATREALTEAVRAGDVDALAEIEGTFAAVARDGVTIRLARTIGRPLRYFVAKRATGPYLVVADRIDAIARYCAEEGIDEQFHPSYTRMIPAHHLVELDQIGCPDPNPRYRRFFSPEAGRGPADRGALGERYVAAIESGAAALLSAIPREAPVGVALSGGADSTLTAWAVLSAAKAEGREGRVRLFTLAIGDAADRRAAEEVAAALGARDRWTAIEASPDDLSLAAAVAAIEDYRPLDVQCAAAALAFARNLRRAQPDLVALFDGDGGDENWKSYPIEDSELTIKSVLNNPLLYHEGWGIDSIKHSLTYTGGFSRGVVRGFAPARAFGFTALSPHAMRPAIAAALSAPLRELVGEDPARLLALKAEVAAAGLASRGIRLPIAPKRRFQHGALAPELFGSLAASRAELRAEHERRFGPRPEAAEDAPARGGVPLSAPA